MSRDIRYHISCHTKHCHWTRKQTGGKHGHGLAQESNKTKVPRSTVQNRWVLCPGAFLTVLCALWCLDRTIEGSVLEKTWQEANMYSSFTVLQIIIGNHYNRALQANQVTVHEHCSTYGWLHSWKITLPYMTRCSQQQGIRLMHVGKSRIYTQHTKNLWRNCSPWIWKNSCNSTVPAQHDKDPMYQWARLNQVMVLLQFQRATEEGNWFLYFASLEKLLVYFFMYNRLDYGQNIPEYIARAWTYWSIHMVWVLEWGLYCQHKQWSSLHLRWCWTWSGASQK